MFSRKILRSNCIENYADNWTKVVQMIIEKLQRRKSQPNAFPLQFKKYSKNACRSRLLL